MSAKRLRALCHAQMVLVKPTNLDLHDSSLLQAEHLVVHHRFQAGRLAYDGLSVGAWDLYMCDMAQQMSGLLWWGSRQCSHGSPQVQHLCH